MFSRCRGYCHPAKHRQPGVSRGGETVSSGVVRHKKVRRIVRVRQTVLVAAVLTAELHEGYQLERDARTLDKVAVASNVGG